MSVSDLKDVYTPYKAEISHFFSIIDECEAEVSKRESEITTLRARKSAIETKIARYHNERAAVNRISEEVLFLVFTELVREDSMAIGPILLVCKKWNNIAINSPTLWRRIELSLAGSEVGIERQRQYVEGAISYSEPALLDINIRFPELEELSEAFGNTPFVHFNHRFHQGERHGLSLCDWYRRVSYYSEYYDFPGDECAAVVLFGPIDNAIYGLMEALAGYDGDTLQRVRSLTLIYNGSIFSTWSDDKLLDFPIPLLEELVLWNNGSNKFGVELSHKSAKLSKIACDDASDISGLLVEDGQLEVLHCVITPDTLYAFPHARFTSNLTTLYLKFHEFDSQYVDSDSESDSNTELDLILNDPDDWMERMRERPKAKSQFGRFQKIFNFPRLEKLIVEGSWPCNLIKAPSLRTLSLLDNDSVVSFLMHISSYPSSSLLSPSRLHVTTSITTMNSFKESPSILLALPSLTEIALVDKEKYKIRAAISKLAGTGQYASVKGYLVNCQRLFTDFGYRYETDEVLSDA